MPQDMTTQGVSASPGKHFSRSRGESASAKRQRELMEKFKDIMPQRGDRSKAYKEAVAQGLLSESGAKELRKQSLLNRLIDNDMEEHFEMLLKMQVDMLTNQSPDDPVNPAEMAQNFVAMFSAAMTAKNANNVEKNTEMMKEMLALQAPSALSLYTLVEKDRFVFDGSEKEIHYAFEKPVYRGQIQISNQQGDVVYVENLQNVPPGEQKFTWNGKNLRGETAPKGHYMVRAIGFDTPQTEMERGESVKSQIAVVDPITDYFINEDGEPTFYSGRQQIDLHEVTRLSRTPSIPIYTHEQFVEPPQTMVDVHA